MAAPFSNKKGRANPRLFISEQAPVSLGGPERRRAARGARPFGGGERDSCRGARPGSYRPHLQLPPSSKCQQRRQSNRASGESTRNAAARPDRADARTDRRYRARRVAAAIAAAGHVRHVGDRCRRRGGPRHGAGRSADALRTRRRRSRCACRVPRAACRPAPAAGDAGCDRPRPAACR